MLSTVLGLNLQLERDRHRAPEELRRRDRALGRELATRGGGELRLLRRWLERVLGEEDLRRVSSAMIALRSASVLIAAFGLVAGAGVAAAIYSYDGSHPINILPAVATFALLPVLLLLPLMVALLPDALVRRIPGLEGLRRTLSILGSGLLALVMRLLPQTRRQDLEVAIGRGRAGWSIFGPVQKWTVLNWSQGFAVAFHLGAIGWFLTRVLVTDLSFTWSTTVEAITPERVHALTGALALPWRHWIPDAVPALADVRATQYFRLGTGSVAGAASSVVDPATLGRWWTFLLACMVTYGLAPRILTWSWCRFRRHRAARWTALHLPGVADVLDRLESSLVQTQSAGGAEAEGAAGIDEAAENEAEDFAPTGRAILVDWSGAAAQVDALEAALGGALRSGIEGGHAAGAGNSLAEDARVRAQVADEVRAAGGRTSVLLVVKAYEPATLEVVDFIRELRADLPEATRIVVFAVGRGGPLDRPADVEQWRRRLATVGDPWLSVVGVDGLGREEP